MRRALVLLVMACHAAPTSEPELAKQADVAVTHVEDASTGSPAPPAVLAPLAGDAWLVKLELEHGDVAFVAPPLGATQPRPIMLGVHGAADRPEWACGGWRNVTDGSVFVVCPQATASAGAFSWSSADQLERVSREAIEAVRARWPEHVADGPVLAAGFSQGARLLTTVATRAHYSPIVLTEGGYDEAATPAFTSAMAETKTRVLLTCSQGGCASRFANGKSTLEKKGVDVRVNYAGPVGHNLDLPAVRSIQRDWSWLVAGDPRWDQWRTSRDD